MRRGSVPPLSGKIKLGPASLAIVNSDLGRVRSWRQQILRGCEKLEMVRRAEGYLEIFFF